MDKKTRDLWKQIEKLRGGNQDPFETPFGPTEECLSANQVVSVVKNDETDPKVTQHLKDCDACRKRVEQLKSLLSV